MKNRKPLCAALAVSLISLTACSTTDQFKEELSKAQEEQEKMIEKAKADQEKLVDSLLNGKGDSLEDSSAEAETAPESSQKTESAIEDSVTDSDDDLGIAEQADVKHLQNTISADQLIAMENHPVLYDYLSEAHIFWDECADGRIDFADDYSDDYESGKTTLVIGAYMSTERVLDDRLIREFEIYPKKEMSLEEGLDLTKTYLPIDILEKWYYLKSSECYYFEEDNKNIYYMLYTPTENGKEAINESKIDYNYAMIMIYVENDVVDTILIRSTNSIPNLGSGYVCKDWSYDFLK